MGNESTYRTEERLNVVSHAIGILLGIVGLVLLLRQDSHKTAFAGFSIIVYSLSFILLFSASTAYHAVSSPILKRRLRVLDHIGIYILIAGTYTPLALITLFHASGWTLFYIVWGIAALGTVLKIFFTGKYELISLILYLAMGWLVVFDYENVLDYVPSIGINLLFLGGAFYTIGTLFYAIKKIPYNHFIWHVFVLAGAVSHWFFIYYGVV
ncbi:hemolysin III family protein [Aggregatimonas sangjinii]|uniref:Hemolysin III family protein n=1 Tax=Aggregatimonas sangjinii TaxID=2583587 RepID=A0A5B7SU63_9FLAO|nr:hemolysin III family protein [Aggregatimonas sangjinii]QCX00558.1 hemolysin III family protein [Aggregatimonas sangjinii]